ncbi:hypothetical protein CONCODRAFT_17295 [Conidiobolus coronatus NRRL 28638]|uniref:C2 domain-containing protein n=1 Tax=Conidiobolus coronatus (strain ATCC 28846 / CBS 209.66 / NRRL 28638) TaxID=796925 RepID=A0A137P7A3_CONC2|nr:hypothetical protein CONCODRAFT_17295 [Conidiobolus coronatus NRRL 28638]|eukprot:KXN70882.1 hypothetical protein CONCODRAFT_17295 [Conidiobolus coronatus NRRL 28638]
MTKLKINIKSLRNLVNKEGVSGKNDIYIVIKVGMCEKFKTKTFENAKDNCEFNETFDLEADEGDLIKFKVLDEDTLIDDETGHFEINVDEVVEKGKVDDWFDIGIDSQWTGEINLSLEIV